MVIFEADRTEQHCAGFVCLGAFGIVRPGRPIFRVDDLFFFGIVCLEIFCTVAVFGILVLFCLEVVLVLFASKLYLELYFAPIFGCFWVFWL